MTYDECLKFLFSQLPIYQRIGYAAYKADLNNTLELCRRLNDPQHRFRSVHIAGTNGKGSVSHMLCSVLMEGGYKTGLYTSPHLKDFRERIKVNGKEISQEAVVAFVEKHAGLVSDIRPSFFEWTVALAFHYFAEEKVDLAVIETGLGGRLDSTNVVDPELSIITNIGFDHMKFLGNTVVAIASEKAGIIKKGRPVIIGEQIQETREVFLRKAAEMGAEIHFADEHGFPAYPMDLEGPYQRVNGRTVLQAISILNEKGYLISDEALSRGFWKVVANTGLRGRWEWISANPRVLADCAHNYEGIKLVMSALENESFSALRIIWGMVSDKDIQPILRLLPTSAEYYFCMPNIPRGLQVKELTAAANEAGLNGKAYSSVVEALNAAKTESVRGDLIYVGGSTFVVAEVI